MGVDDIGQQRSDVPPSHNFGSRYGKAAELEWAVASVTRTGKCVFKAARST
jgi:hypothetical protein